MGRRLVRNFSNSIPPPRGGEGVGQFEDYLINLDRITGTVSHVAVVDSPIWSTQSPILEPDIEKSPDEQKDKGWIVTVYDNPYNTYLEVMTILMLATNCDAEEAEIETWEIGNLGQSVVHRDNDQACQEAAKIIATIGIRAVATPDPLS